MADEKIFLFVNGTTFGRDVVPDVCKTKASLFSVASSKFEVSSYKLNIPAGALSIFLISQISIPRFFAASTAGL